MGLHDGSIAISIGSSRKETDWKPRELLWPALVERLSQTVRTGETVAEFHKMSKKQQDEIKDVGGFVGGALSDRRRKAGSVKSRQLLTLDIDFAESNFWLECELALNCACIMHSTHKHTPDKPRLRLIIPTSRPVKPDEYIAVSRYIAGKLGIDRFDDTTFEPHRLMYWPSTPSDGEYIFEHQDGEWLDPDEILNTYNDWRDPREWPESSRCAAERKRQADKQGDPHEKKNLIGAFCRAYSVSETIETFLKDVYSPCPAPGRYTFNEGSTTAGLIVYDDDKFAYSHHGTDPVHGKLCNAFDLLRIHKYGNRDDDSQPDTPVNKLPSYKAMTEFAIGLNTVKQVYAEMRLGQACEAFKDKEWFRQLKQSEKGIMSCRENVAIILENDENLKDFYAYNDFRECPMVLGLLPWDEAPRKTDVWTDSDDAGLRMYLEKSYNITGVGKIADAVEVAMLHHRIHPVRDYLNSLVWDGEKRIDTMLVDYLGASDTPYVRAVTRKALVGAVARVYIPGCKHDHALTLAGAQGLGKSTIIAFLGGEWYSDSLYTVQGKEAYEQLHGAWIIEMGEMAATRKADVEAVKQFISKQVDRYRAAYGRRVEDHPRQCAFFGTTNDIEFLHDATGGRRFWPVICGENVPKKNLWEEFERDQIWAEAVALFRDNETWHLDAEMEREARKMQETHTEGNAKAGLIQDYLDVLLPENWDDMSLFDRRVYLRNDDITDGVIGTHQRQRVCALEIWCELFDGDIKQFGNMQAREINGIMRKIEGWKRYDSVNGRLRFGKLYGLQRAYVREQ